jgi:competence protein ComEC
VGGLAGALNYATAGVALCSILEHDTRAFWSFAKYLGEQNVSITISSEGDTFTLGSAYVEVLSPISRSSNPNNMSIVIKVSYGSTSFLFTGDAERPAEQDILDAGYDISGTVLKVGHHGSDTSTIYLFLREVMPQYAVISCGKNNSNGYPDENVLSRLRDADVTVYRTDMQGTITCVNDGRSVGFTTEKNSDANTNPTDEASEETYYIGNINLRKLSFVNHKIRALASKHDLKSSWTDYRKWGKCDSARLRFSKSGDENIEKLYATHYISTEKVNIANAKRNARYSGITGDQV